MSALKEIRCPDCDGTGYGIDKFRFPTTFEERMAKTIKTGIIDKNTYTKSGYRIDKTKVCNFCDGESSITVVDHKNYHNY